MIDQPNIHAILILNLAVTVSFILLAVLMLLKIKFSLDRSTYISIVVLILNFSIGTYQYYCIYKSIDNFNKHIETP